MTESIHGIAVISSLSGDGSGLAQKREKPRRRYHDPEQDSVSISTEARNLCIAAESDDAQPDDAETASAENGDL